MRRLKAGPPSTEDYELFAGIVATAAKLVDDRYQAPFTVLVWRGSEDSTDKRLLQVLSSRALNVIDIAECPHALEIKRSKIAHDGHPSSQAYQLLAPWLIEKLNLHSNHTDQGVSRHSSSSLSIAVD